VTWDRDISDRVAEVKSLRSKLLDRLILKQVHQSRQSIKKRLIELNEAIPDAVQDRIKFLFALFDVYKDRMEKVRTRALSGKQSVDLTLESLEGICGKVASETFSRFPLIVAEIGMISNSVSGLFRPQIEGRIENPLQNRFALNHTVKSKKVKCNVDDADLILIEDVLNGLIQQYQSALVTSVRDRLPNWVPLLQEPVVVTQERNELRATIKIMHKLYALYHNAQRD